MSKKDIAKAINVDLSTIYRELNRNSGSRNHYNWETAEANTQAGWGLIRVVWRIESIIDKSI